MRSSPIHGKGVFARVALKKGELVLEYLGAIIDWPEALRRHPHDPSQPNHTFYFALEDEDGVIDGNDGGNRARWINHSCNPNCESQTKGRRVWVRALRDIAAGEVELRLLPRPRQSLNTAAKKRLRMPLLAARTAATPCWLWKIKCQATAAPV